MSDPVLEVNNLSKLIKDKPIVNNVSFHITKGEIVGFVGPNGAGKTSTMRMIVNLVFPSKGDIKIKGYDVQNNFVKAIQHVGGVIEGPQMYGYLTGYQNLLHYARMVKGISKDRIDELAKLVGLKNRIHEKVKKYSLGMKQRLGLAQALLHSPSLLILDEPTNGLDPSGIREINSYIRKLADEEGVSVFISSHILHELEQICDRILFIKDGNLVDEYKMNQVNDIDGKISVEFIVDSIEKAKQYLSSRYDDLQMVDKESAILITMDPHLIPEINKQLVQHNILVSGIQKTSKHLEDKYAEMTGGE